MVADQITSEVVIAAPLERVWAIVTEAHHLAMWLSQKAEIDLRPGGAMRLSWEGHDETPGRVEVADPPRRFAFRWARNDRDLAEGRATLVEMSLHDDPGGTRLRVTERGFGGLGLDEADAARRLEDNTRGWQVELGELQAYVAGLGEGDPA